MIRIYTTPGCFWCSKLKQFLKENAIEYEEIDVSRDRKAAEEMLRKSGQAGVPVIEIDGRIIVGFDEEKIRKALGL
jgi:glutaredoxin-like YruB-family protein